METIRLVNLIVTVLFSLCAAYQLFYMVVPFLTRRKPHLPEKQHRYAVLIAARNEEAVIGQLIDSIRGQDYPAENITVCIVADNCTDRTAEVAREHGALVYEREDHEQVGKGYALNFLLSRLKEDGRSDAFDGFLVLDADNLLDPHYFTEINRTFSDGYRIVTSYRNSKNFGDNWVSSGHGLLFLRESQFLNRPRMRLNTSCVVTGTGFLVSRSFLEECGGWNFFLLSEDTQFTVQCLLRKEPVGYCEDAIFYDEQPTKFRQSWRQRMRWTKGYLQVFGRYTGKLIRGMFQKRGFACYDLLMNNIPMILLPLIGVVLNLCVQIYGVLHGVDVWDSFWTMLLTGLEGYAMLLGMAAVTLFSEWKRIRATAFQKWLSLFTFPLFMATYMPIALAAFFCKAEWKPIIHTKAANIRDLEGPRPKKAKPDLTEAGSR